ncbi:Lnb N-terminal periplasmic domain-containing protein [Pareuzebyella sediminis]|uniref:Lnb N-terminal periplasmic domain-containing protein n=1 Tax=Pareuzebyella sediminis TaxID=2607998 RepID=UPI0011EEED27|nr:DUF4105 domain-containing protein [Pareuzebyella sediminis]
MTAKKILLTLLLLPCIFGYSQKVELSPSSEISVITCGPGNEMYSIFGHSAIRVYDATQGFDVVYNYGTFDFTTPNFTLKFARGKLDYTLSRQNFPYFLLNYEEENRWVKSQKLDLSLEQRQAVFSILETNYLPQNRDYKYDFFYNNCATKIWDVLKKAFGKALVFEENYLNERYTHRELIRQNVPINTWLGFGIDLALGSVIDHTASPKEHMFLPAYTMEEIEVAKLGPKALALPVETIFKERPEEEHAIFLLSPGFWLSFFFVFVLALTYLDFKNNTRRRWLDFSLFLGTGVIGFVIIFLWFFTDHSATAGNLNLIWAFPLNFFMAFVVARKRGPNWVAKYALFSMVLILVCAVLWLSGVQIFSPLLILIGLALLVRYLFLFWSYQKPKLA